MKTNYVTGINLRGSLIVALLITVSLLPGCKTPDKPASREMITGRTWEMIKIMGNGLNMSNYPGGAPTINFTADGRISGKTGCNSYQGSYELKGDSITLDLGTMTKMFCIEPGEIEFTMAAIIVNQMKYSDGRLVLMNGKDEVMELRSK
jgi:heat shock protein HslJ